MNTTAMDTPRRLTPGLIIVALLAAACMAIEWSVKQSIGWTVPSTVIALLLGVVLHPFAHTPRTEPGLRFAVRVLLRIAIALLGLRITFSDIAGLGISSIIIVMTGMALTLASGFLFARLLGLERSFGALTGAACAVCGASATLATSAVLPNTPQRQADTLFTVVMANAASTLVMVLYPLLAEALGFSAAKAGIMIGATVHDMAQAAAAGYSFSEKAGNIAIVVKLLRVAMLLPVVLVIAALFRRETSGDIETPPFPWFALGFMLLAILNTALLAYPNILPFWPALRALGVQISSALLLIAIAALGLATSLSALRKMDWRHGAAFAGTTLVILGVTLTGLWLA